MIVSMLTPLFAAKEPFEEAADRPVFVRATYFFAFFEQFKFFHEYLLSGTKKARLHRANRLSPVVFRPLISISSLEIWSLNRHSRGRKQMAICFQGFLNPYSMRLCATGIALLDSYGRGDVSVCPRRKPKGLHNLS